MVIRPIATVHGTNGEKTIVVEFADTAKPDDTVFVTPPAKNPENSEEGLVPFPCPHTDQDRTENGVFCNTCQNYIE